MQNVETWIVFLAKEMRNTDDVFTISVILAYNEFHLYRSRLECFINLFQYTTGVI